MRKLRVLCCKLAMAALVHCTRLSGPYTEAAQSLVAAKNADSLGSLFVLGMLCNVLIYIAVDGYKSNPHEIGKYLALILGVAVFILAGTEHSVVNTTSLVANSGYRPYLEASMVVVAPAGMAASSTLTPVTVPPTGSSRQAR